MLTVPKEWIGHPVMVSLSGELQTGWLCSLDSGTISLSPEQGGQIGTVINVALVSVVELGSPEKLEEVRLVAEAQLIAAKREIQQQQGRRRP